jgi:hypothetical protein
LFSDPEQDGDVFSVTADYPGHQSEAQAIAVLIRAVAREEGLSLEEVHARVMAAEGEYFVAPAVVKKNPGGRPAKDWEGEYGKSAKRLALEAAILQSVTLGMTKAAARRAVLRAARTKPDRRLADDAEKLKQMRSFKWGKTSPRT